MSLTTLILRQPPATFLEGLRHHIQTMRALGRNMMIVAAMENVAMYPVPSRHVLAG